MTVKIQYFGVDARGQRRPFGGDRIATGAAAVASTNPVPAAPASGVVIARLLSDAPAKVHFGSPPDTASASAVIVRPDAPVEMVVTPGHRPAAITTVDAAGATALGLGTGNSPAFAGLSLGSGGRTYSYASGLLTQSYSDNSLATVQRIQNLGLTAAGQGIGWDFYLGRTAPGIFSGRIALTNTGDYSSAATSSSAWTFMSMAAWNIGAAMTLDLVSGNKSGTHFLPGGDNLLTLGSASLRWSTVYAGSGTINTSDAREKTPVVPLEEREIAAAKALAGEIGLFQFLDACALKGDGARRHIGMTVQRAIAVIEAHGLDPLAYAFICHDTWEAVPAREAVFQDVLGEDDEPTGETFMVAPATPEIPAGDRYGFRADELMLFLARGFDARLAALEAKAA
ncbi:tail fiber domain-containing protein [Methylobacterium flocculans]|uniref:tail fiber domain-containing protein n=1 Tax=Methylobacterium flocculans TaxID=2984843 RepID=UPI0021F34FDE|nr:tail fiber domain-containing protein [Methylobacterium sp. FF17]